MQELSVQDIIEATGGTLIAGNKSDTIIHITTDSRTISEKTLFIPIVGDRFDGHDFLIDTLNNGALAAITHKDIEYNGNKALIKVEDTFKALGDIAKYYKNKYPIPTVAIVGSVGKTTTKDMVASVLAQELNTIKTQGNFNNEIGLPLTVFTIEKEHEAAVLEMGMSGFGEIKRLSSIGKPSIAVMTNIGMSHIEKLGSRENIFKAKMEVTELFTKDNLLIANGDDEFLSATKGMGEYRVIYYGIKNLNNDVFATDINDKGMDGIDFTICDGDNRYKATVNVAGEHNVYNALAAYCVGREFGIKPENIINGIKNFELTKMRMAVEKIKGMTVINDCYNAAPDSIKASVKVLSKNNGRKVAVLGDVLEMGEFGQEAHKEIGNYVAQMGIDVLIAVGENSKYTAQAAKNAGMGDVFYFTETDDAANFCKQYLNSGDVVLIKASRGMKFEIIYNKIKES